MTALVETSDLTISYGKQPALSSVTFSVFSGESVAVLGPNGAGKTTLFRALGRELKPFKGSFKINGKLAWVTQSEHTRLDLPVSALEVALMGAYARTPWYRKISAADRRKAQTALSQVGLQEQINYRYGELSQGQRQRVLIARSLVQNADVLLLDEPFTGVDLVSEQTILKVLQEIQAEGRAILIATHDLEQARNCNRTLCLNRRQVAFGSSEKVLQTDVLQETYGKELITLNQNTKAVVIQHHAHND